jgi:hypothetical protein
LYLPTIEWWALSSDDYADTGNPPVAWPQTYRFNIQQGLSCPIRQDDLLSNTALMTSPLQFILEGDRPDPAPGGISWFASALPHQTQATNHQSQEALPIP